MHYFFDAVAFSIREKAKLVAELYEKTTSIGNTKGIRARSDLLKRMVEIIALLGGDAGDVGAETGGNNGNWDADNEVLQQMIKKTHPKLMDARFADEVLAIWNRNKDNEEHAKVVTEAVNAWAEYVVEKTASDV